MITKIKKHTFKNYAIVLSSQDISIALTMALSCVDHDGSTITVQVVHSVLQISFFSFYMVKLLPLLLSDCIIS